jgi:hypothetical protein
MALMPMFDGRDAMITKPSNVIIQHSNRSITITRTDRSDLGIQRRMREKEQSSAGGEILARQCLTLCVWLARTKLCDCSRQRMWHRGVAQ